MTNQELLAKIERIPDLLKLAILNEGDQASKRYEVQKELAAEYIGSRGIFLLRLPLRNQFVCSEGERIGEVLHQIVWPQLTQGSSSTSKLLIDPSLDFIGETAEYKESELHEVKYHGKEFPSVLKEFLIRLPI